MIHIIVRYENNLFQLKVQIESDHPMLKLDSLNEQTNITC
jgi:hypothetical protein